MICAVEALVPANDQIILEGWSIEDSCKDSCNRCPSRNRTHVDALNFSPDNAPVAALELVDGVPGLRPASPSGVGDVDC